MEVPFQTPNKAAGDSAAFPRIFLASSFFCSPAESMPAPALVTRAIGRLLPKIEELHSQMIFLKMRGKSTEELISIWTEYVQKVYSKDEFKAIEKILRERIDELPPQRAIYKDPH